MNHAAADERDKEMPGSRRKAYLLCGAWAAPYRLVRHDSQHAPTPAEAARRADRIRRGRRSDAVVSKLTTKLAALVIGAALMTTATAKAGGDRELGEYLSSECVTCHQLSGRNDGIPSIVGWPESSFMQALSDFREHRRDNAVMRSIAIKFTDDEMAALAAYFNSLTADHETQSVIASDGTDIK